MNLKRDPDAEPVVAVCGNVATIYGPKNAAGVRPRKESRTFPHRGAAVLFAQEFEAEATPEPNPLRRQR